MRRPQSQVWRTPGWCVVALIGGWSLLPGLQAQEASPWPPRKPPTIQKTASDGGHSVELSLEEEEEIEAPVPAILDDQLVEEPESLPKPDQPVSNDFLAQNLAEVRVEGNDTLPEHAITSKIRSRAGRPTSEQQIESDVQELVKTRLFFNVNAVIRMSDAGPVLVFQVTERPILRSVTFKGNKKIKTNKLEAELGLTTNHAFDVATNKECVERIKQLYKDKGYLHAEVTLEKGGDPKDRDVVFNIVEGPQVKVWNIEFVGNRDVRDAILKTKVASNTVILWKIRGDFDPDIVANDAMTLKKYYNDLGYFDATVDGNFKEREGGKIDVVFNIKEGVRYKVRNQIFEGNNVLTRAKLIDEQKLISGEFFNARFLQQDVGRMKEKYDDLGRLFAKVDPKPRFLEEPGWVDVVYEIDEDRPRTIGAINIHIRGDHPHTREDVVRSQVNPFLKPGNLASGKDLRMARARLMGNQLWDRTNPAVINVVEPENPLSYLPETDIARGQSETVGESIDQVFSEIGPGDWTGRQSQTTGFRPEVPSPSPSRRVPASPTGHTPATAAGVLAEPGAPPQRSLPRTSRSVVPNEPQAKAGGPTEASLAFVGHSTGESAPRPRGRRAASTRTEAPADSDSASHYTIDPDAIFSLGDEDVTVRGQSPDSVYRGQSIDQYGNPNPQNYIESVSPQGDPYGDGFNRPGEPAFVDINIDVSEGRTGRLMFGVGVNSDAGVVGQFTLQEDNFDIARPPRSWADILNGQAWRGRGQSFRLEAMPGSQVSRYLVSWQDPFFLRSDYSFGVSGFYYNRFYNEWTEDRLGGRISLGKLLTRYWSASAALRLENVDIRDFKTPAPTELTEVAGDNFLSTALLTLSHDTRDSAFLPTMGHLFEVSYEQGFGEFNYPRIESNFSQVFTLWERPDGFGKHLLTFRGQVGWTGDDTPIFEKFYAGGYSSFRGFAFRGVTPRDMGFRVGGQWMSLGTVEYMAPITADDNIRAVAFTDFGTVEEDVSMDHFRLTVGLGARLIIPAMGPAPIALDFAVPLMDEEEDNRRLFSFYVGFTR